MLHGPLPIASNSHCIEKCLHGLTLTCCKVTPVCIRQLFQCPRVLHRGLGNFKSKACRLAAQGTLSRWSTSPSPCKVCMMHGRPCQRSGSKSGRHPSLFAGPARRLLALLLCPLTLNLHACMHACIACIFLRPLTCMSPALRSAVCMNVRALKEVAKIWVRIYDFQGQFKTPPLRSFQLEVPWNQLMHAQTLRQKSCIQSKVQEFWRVVSGTAYEMPSKLQIHAESWGLRKLISHVLRRLKMGHIPRVFQLHL